VSLPRTTLTALAAVFTLGTTSMASACCDGVYYAPVVPYPTPVVPTPVAPAPIWVGPWSGGWNPLNSAWSLGPWVGCCGGVPIPPPWGAPSSLYVVNQGPEYSGPGLMVPYGTYSPATGLAAPGQYPYISHVPFERNW